MSFEVLVVCTGNVCRSPLAERLLRARLARAGVTGVTVSSAGTRALAGYAMDAPSAAVLVDLGGDPGGHVARQLVGDMVRRAELILTANTEQRATVVRAEPLAMRRTFTLREFARLAADLPDPPSQGSLAERVAAVSGRRGLVEAPEPGGDEIADPFGAPMPVVRDVGDRISETVDAIVQVLRD